MSSIYDSMNDRQKEAVFYTEGPLLILAGAGSGKTRVLTHRIAYLLDEKHVAPWNILAITFTNKAAEEMKERLEALIGKDARYVWTATFHSTCVRILRRHADLIGYDRNFVIYDSDDQRTLIRKIVKDMELNSKEFPEREISSKISSLKNHGKTSDDLRKDWREAMKNRAIADIFDEYQKRLKNSNAMDFDDLLLNTLLLFQTQSEVLETYQERFRYIHVDEYQDTNSIQFHLVALLSGKYRNLCVVGDDDQSIYAFRGADIRNILDFERVFPDAKVVKLEQNYRSTNQILSCANEVIRNNTGRKEKSLWTQKPDGPKTRFILFRDSTQEAEGIITEIEREVAKGNYSYKDTAILYRTNAQSRVLEEVCVKYNVPYKLFGGVNFYQRAEIKDVIAYLRVILDSRDELSLRRIINVPRRGIGDTSLNRVELYAREENISFYEALKKVEEIPGLGRAEKKIREFVELMEGLKKFAKGSAVQPIYELMMDRSTYRDSLMELDSETRSLKEEILSEFENKMIEFDDRDEDEEREDTSALAAFLGELSLVADTDALDADNDRLTMMTLHMAKGLEFPVVYLTGMEEGIFPGFRSISSGRTEDMEEERRLCYVGMTRAKQQLILTAARKRMVAGDYKTSRISRFVEEVPSDLLEEDRSRDTLSGFFEDERESPVDGEDEPMNGAFTGNSTNYYRSFVFQPKTKGFSNTKTPGFGKAFPMEKSKKPDFAPGDRVRHIKYGNGTIIEVKEGVKDYEISVDFDHAGVRKLLGAFANLKKI